MRFSLWPSHNNTWSDTLALAQHHTVDGWDGMWFADHLMPSTGDVGQPVMECWTMLAALSAIVPRIRLGSLVSGNSYRHPAMLAKQAATADHISSGRIVLGIGAAWQRNEHVAYGIPFYPKRERLARLEEACQILIELLHQGSSSFSGRYYTLIEAPLGPRPVQEHMPILIGGGGEQVTLRIAAHFADEWNVWATPEIFRHKRSVLDRHSVARGRDPRSISCSINTMLRLTEDKLAGQAPAGGSQMPVMSGTSDDVRRAVASYAAIGVDELIVCDSGDSPLDHRIAMWNQFLSKVACEFR